jgi:hypothetical protein
MPVSRSKDQKIAACGSSYRGTQSHVGAAAGCDLLILKNKQKRQPRWAAVLFTA